MKMRLKIVGILLSFALLAGLVVSFFQLGPKPMIEQNDVSNTKPTLVQSDPAFNILEIEDAGEAANQAFLILHKGEKSVAEVEALILLMEKWEKVNEMTSMVIGALGRCLDMTPDQYDRVERLIRERPELFSSYADMLALNFDDPEASRRFLKALKSGNLNEKRGAILALARIEVLNEELGDEVLSSLNLSEGLNVSILFHISTNAVYYAKNHDLVDALMPLIDSGLSQYEQAMLTSLLPQLNGAIPQEDFETLVQLALQKSTQPTVKEFLSNLEYTKAE